MKTTQLVPLTGLGPIVIIWLYLASMIALAFWSLGDVLQPWPTLAGIAVAIAVGVIFSGDTADPISLTSALFVVIVWPLVAALVSWQLSVSSGHALWYYGAATVSLFYLSLRGRVVLAWIGFVLVSGVILLWGVTTDTGFLTALALVGKQLPIMIVGTLFAIGVRRTIASIERLTLEASVRASAEAADLAMTAERNERLAGLDAVATPLLTRLVDGSTLSENDRLEFSVAEAELRDSLRARALSVPAIIAAARDARRRGVDVVLLDDSDPSLVSSADLDAVIARVSEALAESEDGRIVARLLPPGRTDVATLVVDGSRSPRHEVVHTTSPSNDDGPAT